jgi:sugar O-acyltransferase (sialic acid O-acetyltransferase NeuD family)
MKRVLIVGAGGFGREVLSYCSEHPANGREWQVGGFVDDNCDAMARWNHLHPVVASVSSYVPSENDLLICAIGDPALKRRICGELLAKGANFGSFIHPRAVVGMNVKLGIGVVLCPNVILTCDVAVGNFVAINCSSSVGHDSVVGAYTTINGACEITGGVCLGEGVFFGASAVVIPRVSIGDHAVIGAGSVVIRNVKAGETVFGNPARTLVVKKSESAEGLEDR